jgi:hypothetical protein
VGYRIPTDLDEVAVMNCVEIELMVDRLCSFWPQSNIARNTVKSGWSWSEVLMETPLECRTEMLTKCKSMKQFPTLFDIERIAKEVMGKDTSLAKAKCLTCNNNGWVYTQATIDALDAGEVLVVNREVIQCPKCGVK